MHLAETRPPMVYLLYARCRSANFGHVPQATQHVLMLSVGQRLVSFPAPGQKIAEQKRWQQKTVGHFMQAY